MFYCYAFFMTTNNYFSQTKILKHSLSSPLTSLLLNIDLALQSTEPTKVKKNFYYHLSQVKLSAKYLASILELSDNETLLEQHFFPLSSIQEALVLSKKPNSSVKIISHLSFSSGIKVRGNKLLFQEMLICVLNNAVESYEADCLNKVIYLTGGINNQSLEISISDGGKGISWLEMKKITLASYTRKKNHQGIGLFFAKNVVHEQFHGSLILKSKKGHGTTVFISIPLNG